MDIGNGNRNVLLNTLNVLVRISDEDFIKNCWKTNRAEHSIVSSCSEALAILNDIFSLIFFLRIMDTGKIFKRCFLKIYLIN